MFDARYHALSLAAVLVALVLGLLLGVAIGDAGLVSSAEREIRADLRSAVAAGVEERPQRPVPPAHHHHRGAPNRQRQRAARRRQLRLEAGQGPGAVVDRLDVEGEDVGVGVELARQGVAGTPPVEQGADAGEVGHAGPLVRRKRGVQYGPTQWSVARGILEGRSLAALGPFLPMADL